jgi:hypothetical protein
MKLQNVHSIIIKICHTVGTLYGIFVAIFVLVMPSFFKYNELFESDLNKKKDFHGITYHFKTLFIVMSYTVCFIEAYNGMIVYFISDSIFDQFKILLFLSYLSFLLFITFIIIFSYRLVCSIISLETVNSISYDKDYFNFFNKFNFLPSIGLIILFFILISSVTFMLIKGHYPLTWVIFYIVVLILFVYYLYRKNNSRS